MHSHNPADRSLLSARHKSTGFTAIFTVLRNLRFVYLVSVVVLGITEKKNGGFSSLFVHLCVPVHTSHNIRRLLSFE